MLKCCKGEELAFLATAIATLIAQEFQDPDDLALLANVFEVIGDSLATIAQARDVFVCYNPPPQPTQPPRCR